MEEISRQDRVPPRAPKTCPGHFRVRSHELPCPDILAVLDMRSDLTESCLPSGGQTMSERNEGRGEKCEDEESKKWFSAVDGSAWPTQGSGRKQMRAREDHLWGEKVWEAQWTLWPFPGLGTGC